MGIGIPTILISQLFYSITALCVKIMFVRMPEITTFQLLAYRSIIAFAINVIILNKRLKHEMLDIVLESDFEAKTALIARVIQNDI